MSIFGSALVGFLLAVAILVTIHELGHYLAARWCGVRVERFSVGFGPVVLKWIGRKSIFKGTEFAVSAIPLGGYVRMFDTRDPEQANSSFPLNQAFNHQSLWKRSLIVAAGPFANFLLAAVLYMLVFTVPERNFASYIERPQAGTPAAMAGLLKGDKITAINGTPVAHWGDIRWQLLLRIFTDQMELTVDRNGMQRSYTLQRKASNVLDSQTGVAARLSGWGLAFDQPAVVGRVLAELPADKAGMKAGDKVVAVDGQAVEQWSDFSKILGTSPGVRMEIEVVRNNGDKVSLPVTPSAHEENGVMVGRIGVAAANPADLDTTLLITRQRSIPEAMVDGVVKAYDATYLTVRVMWGMLIGEVSLRQVSGPLTMAEGAGATLSQGSVAFVLFLAIVSISIGVLNLLPVPMLDGGQLLYHLIEAIKGAPLSERAEMLGQRIGILFIALLTSLAFYNDFLRILS